MLDGSGGDRRQHLIEEDQAKLMIGVHCERPRDVIVGVVVAGGVRDLGVQSQAGFVVCDGHRGAHAETLNGTSARARLAVPQALGSTANVGELRANGGPQCVCLVAEGLGHKHVHGDGHAVRPLAARVEGVFSVTLPANQRQYAHLEVIIGPAGTQNYAGSLSESTIVPGTVEFTDGIQVITDDGAGNLVGDIDGGGTNTIDYVTGAYDLDFAAVTTGAVVADYQTGQASHQGTFGVTPIVPGTVVITDGTQVVTDDGAGNLIVWDAARAGADISPDTFRGLLPALYPWMGDGFVEGVANLSEWYFETFATDKASTEGLFEDYDHPNTRITHMTVDHELPMTFWRSVGHSYTAFAKESMIDELAQAAGMDEVAFRLQNTQNTPRLNNVIRVAGERMASMTPPSGHHLGFAAHHSFHTDVAEIAEVSVDNGKIRVHKVTCVLDCGQAVNPDIVRSQMEGAVIYGLTAALYGGLNLENGAIKESNFHDYPMLRMSESPEIEVIIIDSGTEPTGVGEPGLPPIAPAVANAVYKATGQRLRSLPLQLA